VGAALANALETNSTLTTLYLSENKFGDKGVEALAKALEKNSTLTTLDLSDCNIGDEGAKALAEALKKNSTLQRLFLSDNVISVTGLKDLASALERNWALEELNIDRCFVCSLRENEGRSDWENKIGDLLNKNSRDKRYLDFGKPQSNPEQLHHWQRHPRFRMKTITHHRNRHWLMP